MNARVKPKGLDIVSVFYIVIGLASAIAGLVGAIIPDWLERLLGLAVQGELGSVLRVISVVVVLVGVALAIVGWVVHEGRPGSREWGIGLAVAAGIIALILALLPFFAGGGNIQILPLVVLAMIAGLEFVAATYLGTPRVAHWFGKSDQQWQIRQETIRIDIHNNGGPIPMSNPTQLVSPPHTPLAMLIEFPATNPPVQHLLSDERRTVIGRDQDKAEIVIDEPTISGEHAAVVFENGGFVLYDLASLNHTHINSKRIQRQVLHDGDKVKLGNVELVFKKP